MSKVWAGSLALNAVLLVGCVRESTVLPSPERAGAEVAEAARAGKLERVFDLLDKNTRWSIMSVHKDRQQICKLIQDHYPKERQARELRRCHLAAAAADARAFFVAYAKQHKQLVEPLARLQVAGAGHGSGSRVELEGGGQRVPFCKEDGGWYCCGLRERFERLKLKAARDLMTVRENTEAYK